MSRVGKRPVQIPDKVKVDLVGQLIKLTGPKGTLEFAIHPDMKVAVQGTDVTVTRPSDVKKHRALHGLTRALIQNMALGVSQGFTRQLQIIGVGFRSEVKGKALVLYLGFSHPIIVVPPAGVTVTVEGINKELVGQTAAKIRSLRPPEPYKGKGVRYVGEQVVQKAGKTAG